MQAKKTALVIGLTKRTSFSLGIALLKQGYTVIFSDIIDNNEKRALISKLSLHGKVISKLGDQSPDLLKIYKPEMLLPSPGVPMSVPLIREALKLQIPVFGDIELFYRWHGEIEYIGITGTDGKTTTSSLLYDMIKREKKSFLGGNIGTPVFDFEQSDAKWAVLELSSFQLETIRDFHPSIAAILNIAPDHLNRYHDMDAYLSAKLRIFKNMQADDYAIINGDSAMLKTNISELRTKILIFSRVRSDADAYFNGNTIYIDGKAFINREDIALIGNHNVENAMAAILMARAAGISSDTIRLSLNEFQGLPHRLEYIRSIRGVGFYNDSKSTTVNSLQKALESFDAPVILIAGGRDKGLDFRPLRTLAHNKLKSLILIGEAANKIEQELAFSQSEKATSMEDAVKKSMAVATEGDIILLSPGCASFDMYENYEKRGEDFKHIVNKL